MGSQWQDDDFDDYPQRSIDYEKRARLADCVVASILALLVLACVAAALWWNP